MTVLEGERVSIRAGAAWQLSEKAGVEAGGQTHFHPQAGNGGGGG